MCIKPIGSVALLSIAMLLWLVTPGQAVPGVATTSAEGTVAMQEADVDRREGAADDRSARLSTTLSLERLEAQFGIRIPLIAVTAAGGLIDLRLKVLDPAKARRLFGERPTMPKITPIGSDTNLETSHKMLHAIIVKKDAVSFALYPNARSAVKPGGLVSVVFDDIRVGPIVAR